MADTEQFNGQGGIVSIRYKGSAHWTIATIRDHHGGEYVVVGSLPGVSVGDEIKFVGTWVFHEKFGNQVKIDSFEFIEPTDHIGILGFLESKLPNIGKQRAELIVEKFGDKTLEIIKTEPLKLTEIKGITEDRAREINQKYLKVFDSSELFIWLKQWRLTDYQIKLIVEKYGDKTKETLQYNPYCMIEDIDGFGWKTVDFIAQKIGIKFDSPFRVRAGCIVFIKQQTIESGNTFIAYDQFVIVLKTELGVSQDSIDNAIMQLIDDEILIREHNKLFHKNPWVAELETAIRLKRLSRSMG